MGETGCYERAVNLHQTTMHHIPKTVAVIATEIRILDVK
jgi:hypothetical protein